ncbi:hypothetical protein [Hoeflea marina]|uniref:hypothetical protein n=1 Tax=Hoeflea marina TaxID=274592 RepID=UPI001FDFF3AD|nr:hypothetical protein [Hoeflea marina]
MRRVIIWAMLKVFTVSRLLIATLVLLIVAFGIGWLTRENPADRPYLKITGSGFIFNYRVAKAFYGFTAYLDRPVANYSRIDAEFEDPSGGPPIVLSEKLSPRSKVYSFHTPPVTGVVKGKPYSVHVRLVRHGDNAVLHDEVFTIASQLDGSILPEKPLTIGPGYHRNPDLAVPDI